MKEQRGRRRVAAALVFASLSRVSLPGVVRRSLVVLITPANRGNRPKRARTGDLLGAITAETVAMLLSSFAICLKRAAVDLFDVAIIRYRLPPAFDQNFDQASCSRPRSEGCSHSWAAGRALADLPRRASVPRPVTHVTDHGVASSTVAKRPDTPEAAEPRELPRRLVGAFSVGRSFRITVHASPVSRQVCVSQVTSSAST